MKMLSSLLAQGGRVGPKGALKKDGLKRGGLARELELFTKSKEKAILICLLVYFTLYALESTYNLMRQIQKVATVLIPNKTKNIMQDYLAKLAAKFISECGVLGNGNKTEPTNGTE